MASTKRKTKFVEPPVSASSEDRFKLAILGVLAAIVLILIWILTLPLNMRTASEDTSASNVFETVGQQWQTGTEKIRQHQRGTEDQPSEETAPSN